jgi:hypothetical protein
MEHALLSCFQLRCTLTPFGLTLTIWNACTALLIWCISLCTQCSAIDSSVNPLGNCRLWVDCNGFWVWCHFINKVFKVVLSAFFKPSYLQVARTKLLSEVTSECDAKLSGTLWFAHFDSKCWTRQQNCLAGMIQAYTNTPLPKQEILMQQVIPSIFEESR